MEMLRLLLLGSAALAPVAAGVGLRPDIGQLGKALDAHYEPNKLWQRANPPADDGKDLVFETIVHYCCEREQDCPTEGDIRLTIETLNEYFSRAKIRFEFQKAVHQSDCGLDPANHDQDAIDRLMARVREGGLDVYNIMIRAGPEAERIGGTCYTPTPGSDISAIIARKDGCTISVHRIDRAGTGPGNSTRRGDQALVHLTGHWLGLKDTHPISQVPEDWGNFMEIGIPMGKHLFWSCEQIRILRQWGNIRKHGQEDGFGITDDAADPPPRGPAGTYCPGAGGSDGGAGGSGGDAGNTDGQSSGEGGGAPASGSPPGGAGCKNPDFKIPPPPAGYGSWCGIPEDAWEQLLAGGPPPSGGNPPPLPGGGQQDAPGGGEQGVPGGDSPPAPGGGQQGGGQQGAPGGDSPPAPDGGQQDAPGGGQRGVPGSSPPPAPGDGQQGVPFQDGQNGL